MLNYNRPPTAEEIINSIDKLSKLTEEEAAAETIRIKSLLGKASDTEKLRLFFEGTQTAIDTEVYKYAPFMEKADYANYFYRAAAAIYINEEYQTLRIYWYKIIALYSEIYSIGYNYQCAAAYYGTFEAYLRAVGRFSQAGAIKDTQKEIKALIGDILKFAETYEEFIKPERDAIGDIVGFKLDATYTVNTLRDKANKYRELVRDTKTILSAITDTIEVLRIRPIIPQRISNYIIPQIETQLTETEAEILNVIHYITLNARHLESFTITEDTVAAIKKIMASLIPYSRTHAHTEDYKKLVAAFGSGTPGDKGLGDKLINAIAEYKRKK